MGLHFHICSLNRGIFFCGIIDLMNLKLCNEQSYVDLNLVRFYFHAHEYNENLNLPKITQYTCMLFVLLIIKFCSGDW